MTTNNDKIKYLSGTEVFEMCMDINRSDYEGLKVEYQKRLLLTCRTLYGLYSATRKLMEWDNNALTDADPITGQFNPTCPEYKAAVIDVLEHMDLLRIGLNEGVKTWIK